MPVTLQKWGHSVGVRLPKPMLEQIGLRKGHRSMCWWRAITWSSGAPGVVRRSTNCWISASRKTGLKQSTLVLRSVERSSDGTRRLCAGAR